MTLALSPGAWLLRALIALTPVLAVLCTIPAGEAAPAWFVAAVLVLGLAWAAWPEAAVGPLVLVLVLAWWGVGLRDGLDPWSLVAAALLLTGHVAAVLASYGPAELRPDRALVRLWVRRGLLTLLAAPALFGLAVGWRGQPDPGGIWVLGLAAALAAIVAASVALSASGEAA